MPKIKFLPLTISLTVVGAVTVSGFFLSLQRDSLSAGTADDRGQVLGVSAASREESQTQGSVAYQSVLDYYTPPPPHKESAAIDPEINCLQSIAVDDSSGAVLFERDTQAAVPLASITKLVTALVFLEHNPGWEKVYELQPEDAMAGGRIYLFKGEEAKTRDFFFLSLVASANTETRALVSLSGLSPEEFIASMNIKAEELGLKATRFVDPIGLSSANVSTAREIARIVAAAFRDETIREAASTKKYEFRTSRGRAVTAQSTDTLLEIFPNNGITLLGGKTGFTNSAGYCFAGQFTDQAGHQITVVVLGSPSRSVSFRETKELAAWVYGNYQW
ncbi:MAG: hypothetical protein MUC28_03935 [Planctomycetes bacterium]|jgi:D-alanyl-D-alanine carboxypeptidase|nr:hypothetical protein [Planctomycetota bacterium]